MQTNLFDTHVVDGDKEQASEGFTQVLVGKQNAYVKSLLPRICHAFRGQAVKIQF